MELIAEAGMELTEDELEQVSGGHATVDANEETGHR